MTQWLILNGTPSYLSWELFVSSSAYWDPFRTRKKQCHFSYCLHIPAHLWMFSNICFTVEVRLRSASGSDIKRSLLKDLIRHWILYAAEPVMWWWCIGSQGFISGEGTNSIRKEAARTSCVFVYGFMPPVRLVAGRGKLIIYACALNMDVLFRTGGGQDWCKNIVYLWKGGNNSIFTDSIMAEIWVGSLNTTLRSARTALLWETIFLVTVETI